jgi:hypothetical protein
MSLFVANELTINYGILINNLNLLVNKKCYKIEGTSDNLLFLSCTF